MSSFIHQARTGCAACLCAASLTAAAQAPGVGFVKTVTGSAWVTTSGQRVPATPGVPVYVGSQLRTEAAAALGVTFQDNTVMSIGPGTDLTVDTYLYAPAQGQLQLGTALMRGTLNYVSGVIAKLKPDAVQVKTPSGIIGVRGTQFVAKVGGAP